QHQVGAAVGVQIGELQIGEREHLGGDRRREREGAARLAVAVARLSISITRLAVAITRLSIAIARLALGARRTALVGRYLDRRIDAAERESECEGRDWRAAHPWES